MKESKTRKKGGASMLGQANSIATSTKLPAVSGIDRELTMKHLSSASWVNKDDDELEARKSCLSYLRKLGKKLRGCT